MKTLIHPIPTGRPAKSVRLCLCLALLASGLPPATAQSQTIIRNMPNLPPGVILPGGAVPGSPPPPGTDSGKKNAGGGPWMPSEPLSDGATTNATDEIQLSFQGANIDMIAQWLAQTTGKTVIKHPRVQCQLNIMSSKKLTRREAVNMVYRALALEGFSAIELSNSILIVPEGQEPKMSPEVVTGSLTNVPAGRQLLVKVFPLRHIAAADLKERIRTALSDKATVDVDDRANQIIITDYNDNLRVAGELIEALDSDRPEDVAVRVVPLKHIAADQLAKEMQPLYQKFGGKAGGKTTIDVTADDRSNSLIVLSSLMDFNAIEKLVLMLDTEDAQEKTMQTFILKNADAQDVAKQLQDLNQNQSSSGSRFPYFFSGQQNVDTKKVSVVADRRRNAVVVQAPPTQMDGIAKMIQELDEPVSDDSLAPRIYPLKYVSAVDIESVLNELFLKKTQQRSYFDYFNNDSSSTTDNQDVGRLYGKVRITSEPYANAIIVTSNSKENLGVIEDVLKQLDAPSQTGDSTLRIGLKFAKSETVANSLNILFAKNGSPAMRPVTQPNQNGLPQQAQQSQQNTTPQSNFELEQETKVDGYYPWLGGQPDNTRSSDDKSSTRLVSDLVGRVRCVGDQRGNAVLISANVHFFPQILKLIHELDAPSDKVSIEARIVEVSSDFLDRMGVRWSPDGSQVFTKEDYNNSLIIHTAGKYQQGFGGNTTVNTPVSPTDMAQTLASLKSGVVASTINIDFLVQFMKQNTDATVLGEPSITIDDNELGRLFVGQQVPVPNTTQVSSAGSQNTSFTYKDVGVVLEVTPHINSDGDVQLKIHTESSTVVPGDTVLGGSVFDTRTFHTDVTTKDGQTLVIGGIIQKQTSEINYKTPILGSIPGLKYMFNKKDKTTREVELMVFLKPTVVHSAMDAMELERKINEKTPLLNKWREESSPKTDSK